MMQFLQAITTRYHGPTNFRGSRISARCAAGHISMAYQHRLGIEANHAEAAKMLADKLKWGGQWFGGGTPDGNGYCFVQTPGVTATKDCAFVTHGER